MPSFKYIAQSIDGKRIDGSVEAADRSNAMLLIQQLGHTPLSITQAAGKSSSPKSSSSFTKRFQFKLSSGRVNRMKPRAMLLFTREMADLLSSGMTLGRALHTLARRDSEPDSAGIIKRLRDEVIQGSSISDALLIYPETFPKLYVSMVRAGEASGALDDALRSLCSHYERVQAARSKVTSAMIYPAIVMLVGILSVIGLMVFIIPKFSTIFDELGGAMPLPTRILMLISNAFIHYGWLMLIILFFAIITFQKYIRTEKGHKWLDAQQLRLPVISKITRANAFAHFARTLQTLIHNGVPILKALTISEETVGNCVIAAEISDARARVTDGSSIAGPLAAGGVFPPLLTDMLSVGEETGDLPGALSQIARRYDEELDFSIKVLTTVLEPVMILGIALVIGFVAISMLMAVFDLTSGLGA
ncbi:MAG: type II secretion system F family protein [Kiritimatiellaceae bacterium]|nr:type II secretion system F family protein [Kiritimatiellaceae bacterium]